MSNRSSDAFLGGSCKILSGVVGVGGVPGLRGLWGSGAGGSQDICVCSPRHGARGEHAMASEEHKMAFAEHARKGGAGLRVFPRSTETYHPRRKNIMNSIFRQNVFAKNNVLQITYISPRLPQRFVLFCFFFVSPQRVYPFWNSNSKQIPFLEFKFHFRNMSCMSAPPYGSECH